MPCRLIDTTWLTSRLMWSRVHTGGFGVSDEKMCTEGFERITHHVTTQYPDVCPAVG